MSEKSEPVECWGKYYLHTNEEYYNCKSEEVALSGLWDGFVSDTTLHGPPHVDKSRGLVKKMFWIILTTVGFGVWIYNTYELTKSYMAYGVTVSLDIRSERQLKFPAVTVCNMNPIRLSQVTQEMVDILLGTEMPDFEDPMAADRAMQGLSSSKSMDSLLKDMLSEYLADMDIQTRLNSGHQQEDFILHCEFNGAMCSKGLFTYTFNWKFGNCFTFNSGNSSTDLILTSTDTGPSTGLRVVLNIEQENYLNTTFKAGARVQVHPQHEPPFPEDKGIDVSPGFSTAVGIRQGIIAREGGIYGNCTDATQSWRKYNAYEEKLPWTNYTLSGCQKTCYQRSLIARCHCYDARYPEKGEGLKTPEINIDYSSVKACNTSNMTEQYCKNNLDTDYKSLTSTCDMCWKPCNETYFTHTVSTSRWPAKNAKESIKSILKSPMVSALDLPTLNIPHNFDWDDYFETHLLEVEIFFEELNYEEIVESPTYTIFGFLSDLGGALGLWAGGSLLTCGEFLEFGVDACVLAVIKFCKRSKPGRKRTGNVTHDASDTELPVAKYDR